MDKITISWFCIPNFTAVRNIGSKAIALKIMNIIAGKGNGVNHVFKTIKSYILYNKPEYRES
jgi:hypothetical protein